MKAIMKFGMLALFVLNFGGTIYVNTAVAQEQPKKPYVHKKSVPNKKLKGQLKKKTKITKDLRYEKIN